MQHGTLAPPLAELNSSSKLIETTAPVRTGDLPRVLGVSHATAIVVGTIIGSGIFLVPQEMMRAVGSSTMVYLAWIVGGLLSLFGAMTYAELGAMMPATGGEYVYLRGAYGDLPAFLYMWTWFSVAKPASIASVTTGLARTLAIFPALAWLDGATLHGGWEITWSQIFAIAATWLVTGLNYLGIRKAGEFQLFFTWLKGGLILVIAGFCFASSRGSLLNFHTFFPGAHGGFGGFMIALIAALWAYDGWNDLTMVAGEVRRPERSLPIALIAGLFIVGGLYMATNAAIQYILPAAQIAASPRPAVTAMALVVGGKGGSWGAALVSAAMAISIVVTLNGTIMSGARIPFAAARDKLFFARMATIHPRFQSPSTSLIVQGILATVLLLAVGRFQQLFELAIFAEWLFYLITATTVFVYRRRLPNAVRPYRVWGYPVLPALFVLASALLLYFSYVENLKNSLIGTGIILLGIPLFGWIRRNRTA
ncbi:amino acid permease-associated region [Acidisarcina polymorpha]|uniref:Amino acid permease-associated region n=1 Tax=Acidisarcina polymorpha TaxID=2211140 RepID=A0A2Z5G6F7_9BACT|nr:amino acid permease [Acidisarcina polymorpha]AXC14244.1 amino acid permease-associated region [Acidisarcina polymorpha]